MRNPVVLAGIGLLLISTGLVAGQTPPPAPAPGAEAPVYTGPKVYRAEVLAEYPHDSEAFTQGLLWHEGAVYESTGQVGQSRVRKVELETGKVLAERAIPPEQFGEGLALWEDEFISLTWQDGAIHRWKADDLSPIRSFSGFPYEGWGLTTFEEGLIHSDGSATLRVLEPTTYDVERSVDVTLNGRPLGLLNELEFIDGLVFANIWQTGYIVAIDPADGRVHKLIDLRHIVAQVPVDYHGAVLNGIAWDAENRRLFVTGKLWPSLFEIRLVETDAQVR
ncbi:glutaminyl-peptide cyclotransferase [Erythrobacter sp. GH1-10]|uniref:glutaminyl-peptide cyclotransferase n=1 Tax=Erythrobacter sp. GH1-10 TaxID=3349334 RepID=UPI003878261E